MAKETVKIKLRNSVHMVGRGGETVEVTVERARALGYEVKSKTLKEAPKGKRVDVEDRNVTDAQTA